MSTSTSQTCANPSCPSKSEVAPTLLCSRCRTTRYCSQPCQAASWATHKNGCQRPNYVIKFHLAPGDIVDPPVVRTISFPSSVTFMALHEAIQTAFNWATTH